MSQNESSSSAQRGLTPTQKFILGVFGAMVVAGVLSLVALTVVNNQRVAPGAATPNSHCTRQLAAPQSDESSGKSQTYLDTDFYGCQTLGMSESAGVAYLESKNLSVRIASRDGEDFMLTEDYSESRVNLTIIRSIITDYNVG